MNAFTIEREKKKLLNAVYISLFFIYYTFMRVCVSVCKYRTADLKKLEISYKILYMHSN